MAERLQSRGVGEDVDALIAHVDALLTRLEQAPGPTAELAMDTVQGLIEVYGTALSRVMARLSDAPELAESLSEDELLHHLFVLHGIHPDPVDRRVARALDGVRPYIRSHGGDVELLGIEDGVARVRLSGSCEGCASSRGTLERVVGDAVLTSAPELSRVEAVAADATPAAPPALIPVEMLRRIPVVQ